jgi:hypothetical protein
VIGPILELKDPGFLRWSNLRHVITFGLAVGVLTGLFDAVLGGWDHVSVLQVVFTALWFPLVSVLLHLFFRPSRRKRSRT